MLDYNATFINDCGIALLNSLANTAWAGSRNFSGTFVSPVSVMLALALLLNGAAPGSATFWCAPFKRPVHAWHASAILPQTRR